MIKRNGSATLPEESAREGEPSDSFALGALAAGLGIANQEGGDRTGLDRPSEGPFKGSEPPLRIELVDFALRDHEGALVRSSSLRGKVVLVTFLDSRARSPALSSRHRWRGRLTC